MPDLVRLAPYIDVEVVRARMVNAVKRALKSHDYMLDSYKEQYEEFIAGDRHVIPLAYQLDTKLLKILERIAGDRHDRRFQHAYREFVRYFFYTDAQLGINL
jgi:hypothetical protein